MNIAAAVLFTIRETPARLRLMNAKLLSTKTIGSLCQMIACNCTVLAWVALTFCSIERLASTRIIDRYDRRFRSREATVLTLCFLIPLAVILVLLQYVRSPEIVFAAELAALFSLNLLLLLFHYCTASRLSRLPQTLTKKFQVRQNIKVHQAFLRLDKHLLCWGSAVLLVLLWAIFVMKTAVDYPYYEAIYFVSQAALYLLTVYLLFTEPVIQPALRSFMISRWILRKSSHTLSPISKIADTSLNLGVNNNQESWRPQQ